MGKARHYPSAGDRALVDGKPCVVQQALSDVLRVREGRRKMFLVEFEDGSRRVVTVSAIKLDSK
jgi:hypothetical protein